MSASVGPDARPAGCPPWCVIDHTKDGATHMGAPRTWVDPETLDRVSVSAYRSAYPGSDPGPLILSGKGSLYTPASGGEALADLLGGLGHPELAGMIRDVVAEIESGTEKKVS